MRAATRRRDEDPGRLWLQRPHRSTSSRATAPASSTLSAAGATVWPRFASAGPVEAEKGAQAALAGTTTAAAIHERPRDELHAARQALTVIELQTSVERFFVHDSRRNSERQAEPIDFGMIKTIACSRIELKHALLRPDLEHPRACRSRPIGRARFVRARRASLRSPLVLEYVRASNAPLCGRHTRHRESPVRLEAAGPRRRSPLELSDLMKSERISAESPLASHAGHDAGTDRPAQCQRGMRHRCRQRVIAGRDAELLNDPRCRAGAALTDPR